MKTKNILAGIELLLQYHDDPEGFHLCAIHDEILLMNPTSEVPDEVKAQMAELGWRDEGEHWTAYT